MVIGKPFKMEVLDKLLVHIQNYDCVSMHKQGYKLVETDNMIQWSIHSFVNSFIN